MFLQGRLIVVWISWFVCGLCGLLILLAVACYCRPYRLMPRQHKSFDEQYLKETYTIKENHIYTNQGNYTRVKNTKSLSVREVRPAVRQTRPASYAAGVGVTIPTTTTNTHAQYASSGTLVELEATADDAAGAVVSSSSEGCDALKTRSLPAFLRPRPRPLSSETDLYQLYSKVNMSKNHSSRMRSEHAALIALSKSRSQPLDIDVGAVVVYDQRTML